MIKINEIRDAGNLQSERLVLNVLQDCDLGFYLVARTHRVDSPEGGISPVLEAITWLPDLKLKAGEVVALYSCSGVNGESVNEDGIKVHKIYCNNSRALNIAQRECFVLLEIKNWNTTK